MSAYFVSTVKPHRPGVLGFARTAAGAVVSAVRGCVGRVTGGRRARPPRLTRAQEKRRRKALVRELKRTK